MYIIECLWCVRSCSWGRGYSRDQTCPYGTGIPLKGCWGEIISRYHQRNKAVILGELVLEKSVKTKRSLKYSRLWLVWGPGKRDREKRRFQRWCGRLREKGEGAEGLDLLFRKCDLIIISVMFLPLWGLFFKTSLSHFCSKGKKREEKGIEKTCRW